MHAYTLGGLLVRFKCTFKLCHVSLPSPQRWLEYHWVWNDPVYSLMSSGEIWLWFEKHIEMLRLWPFMSLDPSVQIASFFFFFCLLKWKDKSFSNDSLRWYVLFSRLWSVTVINIHLIYRTCTQSLSPFPFQAFIICHWHCHFGLAHFSLFDSDNERSRPFL